MTQIIATVQSKGGTGKSTILKIIAGFRARLEYRILVIDTDPQFSTARWAEKTDSDFIDYLELLNEEQIIPIVENAKGKYDIILIDTAGYDSRMATYAINVADTILIPTNGSEDDVRGAIGTTSHVNTLNIGKTNPAESIVILWKTDKGTSATKHARKQLESVNVSALQGYTKDLTGFTNITWNGGIPDGAAYQAAVSFIHQLEKANILRTNKKEAAA